MAKILIIDDSESLRRQLGKDLASGGHEVVEAEDGLKGLEVYESTDGINLIICDVNMPKMDGLTMCEKIKKTSVKPVIPIFMLTTESSDEMKKRGQLTGVTAWITKPYATPKLLQAVEKVLSRGVK